MRAQLDNAFSSFPKKVSQLFSFFAAPAWRIIVPVLLLIFASLKSFSSSGDSWRTLGSLLILGLGFALIFQPSDKWSVWAGFVLIMLLAISPFYWRLQGLDTDGQSITGVLPHSDSYGYYTGAVTWLYGGLISPFSARRPLYVVFLSTLLFLSRQNLITALLGMALLVAVAILLFAMEVRQSFGVFTSAIVIIMMIFCYTGRYAGKFLTEQLGIPLGMLSLALILRGLRIKEFKFVTLGVFVLTLALNARAGAFLVLPLLVLWGGMWQAQGRFSFKYFGILSACVLLGFILNFLVFKSVATPGSMPFSNFGSTLYGMVTGYRGWQSFYSDYPGVSEQAAFGISLKIFLSSPGTFFIAAIKAYRDFINPFQFFSFLYLPVEQMIFAACIFTLLTLRGLWQLAKHRSTLFARMMLSALAGIIISVPFVPPIDDGFRAMAATIPFLALLAGLSFGDWNQYGLKTPESTGVKIKADWLAIFSGVFILLIAIGWIGVKGAEMVVGQEPLCNPNETAILIPVSGGSYINVVSRKGREVSLIPDIRINDLQRDMAHYAPISIRMAFQKLQVGQTMMLGLNLASSQVIWLIAPTNLVRNFNGQNSFCALQTHQPGLDQEGLYIERTVKNVFVSP